LLLGVLERQGASTAEELAQVMGHRREDVTSLMVALYSNRLVEIEGDVITISHHGKSLIDRFSIGDAVIKELVHDIAPVAQQEAFWTLLERFRRDDYGRFLASVRTQRMVDRWSVRLQGNAPRAPAHLALLVRDVDDWAATSPSPWAREASTKLRVLVSSIKGPGKVEASGVLDQAVVLFTRLRPSSLAAVETSPESEDRFDAKLNWVLRLDSVQRDRSSWDWLRASCATGYESKEDPITVVERWFTTQRPHGETLESRLQRVLFHRQGLQLGSAEPVGDTLGVLLASSDRSEFANALGLSEEAAFTLLRALRDKCSALTTEREETPSGDE
jgi:hypothetical protein